jgi:1-acyl-sn-glycerol-3-phosphate acyltransferase
LLAHLWYLFIKNSSGLMFRIFFGLRVLGAERVPRSGAALLLANHASHFDPVLVGVASPRQLRFLARDTLFFWPLGWLIDSLGAVPIRRDGSGIAGLRATLKILKAQDALLLFPEGTRSTDGQLQPLKPGFCAVARRSRAALVPVGIAGSYAALPRGRMLPRLKKIVLQFGQPITTDEIDDLDDDQLVQLISASLSEVFQEAADCI